MIEKTEELIGVFNELQVEEMNKKLKEFNDKIYESVFGNKKEEINNQKTSEMDLIKLKEWQNYIIESQIGVITKITIHEITASTICFSDYDEKHSMIRRMKKETFYKEYKVIESLDDLSIDQIYKKASEFKIAISKWSDNDEINSAELDATNLRLPDRKLDETDLKFINMFLGKEKTLSIKTLPKVQIEYKKPNE